MKRLLLSLLPTSAGKADNWWYEFPEEIGAQLRDRGVEHISRHWRYLGDLATPGRPTINVEQITNPAWVRQNLLPLLRPYAQCIVHTHAPPAHTALWQLKCLRAIRCRWLMTDHYAFPIRGGAWAGLKRRMRAALRRCGYYPDVFIAVSDATHRHLVELFGPTDIQTILNGIRIPTCDPPAIPSGSPTRALFIGRLMPEKGVRCLLEAMREIKRHGIPLELTVVGQGPDEAFMRDYVQREGLGDVVAMHGVTLNPEPYYRRAEFAIIPSEWVEPCPLVSLEAQAHYLPCIYSDRGGLPETQVNGETGLMVPAGRPEAIVAAVQKLRENTDRYYRMRLAARRNVERRFSLQRMAADYVELYLREFERMS